MSGTCFLHDFSRGFYCLVFQENPLFVIHYNKFRVQVNANEHMLYCIVINFVNLGTYAKIFDQSFRCDCTHKSSVTKSQYINQVFSKTKSQKVFRSIKS